MSRKTKSTALVGICASLIAAVLFIGYPDPSGDPHSAVAPQGDASGVPKDGAARDAGRVPAGRISENPSLEQHRAAVDLGKLSQEEEERLRLADFEQYLHYKSRLDGSRDRELMGLTGDERKNAVFDRVKERLSEALENEASTSRPQ